MTGLGYGLTWMGIQGFVVRRSASETLTFSIANMTAGIFTGHMVGTILGGVLAETTGYATVFAIGAAATLVPALYAAVFLRKFIQRPSAPKPLPQGRAGSEFLRLLRDRDFLCLLGASVIPFSVAQVGLLYYAIPIFLEADGFKVSAIAQVLAIYSATLVFVAPPIARYVDGFANKKLFIAAGALLGSCSLLLLFAAQNIIVVIIAVAVLGLASSVGGAAQTSYALQLRQVQRCGPAMATAVQRAADKFGQMLGPLLLGCLSAGSGIANGVATAGALYLIASFFFVIFARPGSGAAAAARS
jgi:predicted MFS family arabinose efflux permease